MMHPDSARTDALWEASERSRGGPTHLCHHHGHPWWKDVRRGQTHKCDCGIGRDHSIQDYWEWDFSWEPDEQWKGLWR
jgi:hypothetical protein